MGLGWWFGPAIMFSRALLWLSTGLPVGPLSVNACRNRLVNSGKRNKVQLPAPYRSKFTEASRGFPATAGLFVIIISGHTFTKALRIIFDPHVPVNANRDTLVIIRLPKRFICTQFVWLPFNGITCKFVLNVVKSDAPDDWMSGTVSCVLVTGINNFRSTLTTTILLKLFNSS